MKILKTLIAISILFNCKQLIADEIHDAAADGNIELIAQLTEDRFLINAPDERGRTPLHHAAMQGRRAACEQLLRIGAKINARDNDGNTPRMLAEKYHHASVALLLKINGGISTPLAKKSASKPKTKPHYDRPQVKGSGRR